VRLSVGFLGVALVSIALFAVGLSIITSRDIARLEAQRRVEIEHAMHEAVAEAWTGYVHGFAVRALDPAFKLADGVGAGILLRELSGSVVKKSAGFARMPAESQRYLEIRQQGHVVGAASIRFSPGSPYASRQELLADLLRAIALTALVAGVIALALAVGVAKLFTRPINKLASAVDARKAGDRKIRVGNLRGPTEVRQVGAAFDAMADAVDEQELAHRNLMAELSHDIRTPVAVIIAGNEAILDGVAAPDREHITSMLDQAWRLDAMAGSLSRLATTDAAVQALRLRPLDVADLCRDASRGFGARLRSSGLRFSCRLQPAQVLGDQQLLERAVANLLSNAAKFTPPGGEVVLEAGPDDGAAVIKVSDSGVGIAADELPKIFERFYRGPSAAPTAEGTGIGLATVKETIDAHHGEIAVSSEPGHGTTIAMRLPLSTRRNGQSPAD
jgi:two-component system sensor histidine kinase BaeS